MGWSYQKGTIFFQMDFSSAVAVGRGSAARLTSVREDGAHSIGSVLNPREGAVADGWYWQVDTDATTLLGIINVDTEEATVEVWLDYYSDGQSHRYNLPNTVLPARASGLIDLSLFVGSGVPDADGDLIPPGVTFGGYRVRKVGEGTEHRLTVESLLVNRRTKTYLPFYNTCCGYTDVFTVPSSISGPVGSTAQVVLFATDACSFIDIPLWASFSSSDSNVASVDDAQGFAIVSLNNPGTASVTGSAWIDIAQPGCLFEVPPIGEGDPGPIVCCGCTTTSRSDSTSVTVKPTVTISGPASVPLRGFGSAGVNSINLTAAGNPQGGTFAWSTASAKVSLGNINSQTVTVFSQAQSAAIRDVPIQSTYSLNGQSAIATYTITVQKPTRLAAIPGTSSTTSEAPCTTPGGLVGCGVIREFDYQVEDQFGLPIQHTGMDFWDSIVAGSTNGCNLAGFTTTCSPPNTGPCGQFTNGIGAFHETLSICAPACRSTSGICIIGCETTDDQTWNVNGFFLTADVKHLSYQCNRILVNGQ